MKQFCTPNRIVQETTRNVRAFFARFNQDGRTADFADRRGIRSKVVIMDFQATGPKIYLQGPLMPFDFDEELNRSRILSIEVLSTAQMVVLPTQPPKDSPQATLNRGFLVLKDTCNNEVMRTPLSNLCKALNGNKTTFVNMLNIQWDASGLQFNGASGITSANAIAFKINFTPLKKK
jgi:hypothetical protein